MSLSRLVLVFLCILAAAVAGVAGAPANWVARWTAQQTGGAVLLADAQGTLWHGSAVVGVAHQGRALALPGRIEWLVRAPEAGAMVVELVYPGVLAQPVKLHLGLGGVQIAPGEARVPVAISEVAGAPFNTVRPEGSATLNWELVRIGTVGASGSGVLRVSELASALSTVNPLGDYRIAWQYGAEGLIWHVETERGPLALTGQGKAAAGRVRFSGRAMVQAGTTELVAARLTPLVDALGPRVGGGAQNGVSIEIGT